MDKLVEVKEGKGKLVEGIEGKRDLVEGGFSVSNLAPVWEAITEEVHSSTFGSMLNSMVRFSSVGGSQIYIIG